MKLVISGGGTGGHFFPAMEVIRKAKDRNIDLLFVGAEAGIEKRMEEAIPVDKIFLESRPLRGVSFLRRIKSIVSVFKGVSRLRREIKEDFSSLIFGGYVSVPVGVFTLIKRRSLFLHEQNSVPSMTNRTFYAFAKKAFITFEYTRKFFKGKNVVKTGFPIREELLKFRMDKNYAKDALGFEPEKPLILFMGGSQGAKFLNSLAVEIARTSDFQLLLLSGETDYERVIELSKGLENLKVFPFRTDMGIVYSASDVAVCRAGAGTVSELSFFRVPAVFIPYPYAAGDHQYYNAKEIEDLGGALVIRQEDVTPQKILALIERALDDRSAMSEKIGGFTNPKAADLILDEILQDGS